MTRRRRIAVLAAVTALALSACTNQDADINDVRDALEEADISREQVRDCTNAFDDAGFSQDELNDIQNADTLDDLEGDLGDQVRTLLEDCTSGSTTTEESDEGSGEPSETTTTAP
jgi:hypothetical protein